MNAQIRWYRHDHSDEPGDYTEFGVDLMLDGRRTWLCSSDSLGEARMLASVKHRMFSDLAVWDMLEPTYVHMSTHYRGIS